MSDDICKERMDYENGGDGGSTHCLHVCSESGDRVCCWCGDLFCPPEAEAVDHGPFAPTRAIEDSDA